MYTAPLCGDPSAALTSYSIFVCIAGRMSANLSVTDLPSSPSFAAVLFYAVLFDNDGVLVYTEGHYFQANREALRAFLSRVLGEAGRPLGPRPR